MRNCDPDARRPSAACSGRWIGRGERPIPSNYDEQGRIRRSAGKRSLRWKSSKGYQKTRRRKAAKERKLAAHRKSLHGRKVHEIVAVGNTIITEKISYEAGRNATDGAWDFGPQGCL